MVYNLIFLSVSLFIFLSYRQGLKDGIKVLENKEIKNIIPKMNSKSCEQQSDIITHYNELLNYNFDKAGEKENG